MKKLPDSERRILRSDQRDGKNFPQVNIDFGRDGWLEVRGSMEEAEIQDVKPKIRDYLETKAQDVLEKEIHEAIPIRDLIISGIETKKSRKPLEPKGEMLFPKKWNRMGIARNRIEITLWLMRL